MKQEKVVDGKVVLNNLRTKRRMMRHCPSCGGLDVGIKDTIVDLRIDGRPGFSRRKIWAYCRNCDYETRKLEFEVPDNDDDFEIVAGYGLWNEVI